MSKKWYVLHTYSGYENKVKKNLETRIETMGLENNVFGIEIPTEMVTEIKDGGRRVESEKKVFPGLRAGTHGAWTTAAGPQCATRRA